MEQHELAQLKIDRAIRLSERFEEMDEEEFKRLLSFLENVINIIPKNTREKEELQAYLGLLNNMEFKKYGFIFKGFSKKGCVILTKRDIENMVWTARSLLF